MDNNFQMNNIMIKEVQIPGNVQQVRSYLLFIEHKYIFILYLLIRFQITVLLLHDELNHFVVV